MSEARDDSHTLDVVRRRRPGHRRRTIRGAWSRIEVEIQGIGAFSGRRAGDPGLEDSLPAERRQTAGALVGHDHARSRIADAAAGAADDHGAGPTLDGPGEGPAVAGGERTV